MGFEEAYQAFIIEQTKGMTKEERASFHSRHDPMGKLFLEQVWWPIFGNFDYLYAEYEVDDYKDGTRYLDFAYIRPPFRINIDLDGFKTHYKDISRWQFTDNNRRQNHIVLDGWKVFRFSYDDVKDNPRQCQQFIQQIIGRFYGNGPIPHLSYIEREIIRIAMATEHPIRPIDMKQALEVGEKQARCLLRGLSDKGIIIPCGMGNKVCRYKMHPTWRKRWSDLL